MEIILCEMIILLGCEFVVVAGVVRVSSGQGSCRLVVFTEILQVVVVANELVIWSFTHG